MDKLQHASSYLGKLDSGRKIDGVVETPTFDEVYLP